MHQLTLENKSSDKIEVIYYPALDSRQINNKTPETIEIKGRKMDRIFLDSSETILIGTVVAMYTPKPDDIDVQYLEIRFDQDTISLTGKNAILTAIQKVGKLNWRIIINEKDKRRN